MGKTASLALLIALIAQITSAQANCEYEGKQYKSYDVVSILSDEYTQEVKNEGHSGDAYALVFVCTPVVDTNKLLSEGFTMSSIPVKQENVWALKKLSYGRFGKSNLNRN